MAQQVARDDLEQHFEHGVVGHGLISSGRLRLRPSHFHPRPAAGYSWWALSFVLRNEIEAGAFGPQGSLTPHGSLLSAAEVGRDHGRSVESARIIGGVGALERGDDEARIGALQRVLGLADNPPRAAPTVYRRGSANPLPTLPPFTGGSPTGSACRHRGAEICGHTGG